MSRPLYMLMDGRAAYGVEDATILVASEDPVELCEYANAGSFGDGCLIVKEGGEVMWPWFQTGAWRCND